VCFAGEAMDFFDVVSGGTQSVSSSIGSNDPIGRDTLKINELKHALTHEASDKVYRLFWSML
jgi:hypothetical protein